MMAAQIRYYADFIWKASNLERFTSSATACSRLFDNIRGRVVILGLDNAGKTSLLYHYLSQKKDYNDVIFDVPTLGRVPAPVTWRRLPFDRPFRLEHMPDLQSKRRLCYGNSALC